MDLLHSVLLVNKLNGTINQIFDIELTEKMVCTVNRYPLNITFCQRGEFLVETLDSLVFAAGKYQYRLFYLR